jgi:phosphoribosylamine--glycine ligase
MNNLKVLVIGSGGREHALAWKLAQSARVERVFVAPGNAGTATSPSLGAGLHTNINIADNDIDGLLHFAQENEIGLTVVGPEVPLSLGIVDRFQAAGLTIFGPSQAAAQLESSKAFSKAFMAEMGIATAQSAMFTEYEAARDYLEKVEMAEGIVIKASGLAAGKGVIVCDDLAQAEAALQEMMLARAFGGAADEVVIEARLSGPEVSLLAFCDGRTAVPMLPARDHKRAYDGDEGPNTGGMGAYAPPPDVDEALVAQLMETVIAPTVAGMAARGMPYVGVLYAGIMLTSDGPQVLEFNCRFGDPETQVILPMLASDLVEIMLACVEGRLTPEMVQRREGACATIVMAAPGYPGSYPKGLPITGLETAESDPIVTVFHAGTKLADDGLVVTSGGRVLAVSAWGDGLATAVNQAYAAVEKIHFEGAHYRKDIGKKI